MAAARSQNLIMLHSNDLHGRVDGLGRIATLVARIQEQNPDTPVVYIDAGDSEEMSNRLSSITKGVAMHRLLSAAGCQASAVGNAAIPRYGPEVLVDIAAATNYPHLLANYRMASGEPVPGTQAYCTLDIGGHRLGLIGVTAEFSSYEQLFHLCAIPVEEAIERSLEALARDGVEVSVLLSHLGLEADRELAERFQDRIPLIVGGHSHSRLEEGEQQGTVMIVQAGEYARELGQVDLRWEADGLIPTRAALIPVEDSLPIAAGFAQEIGRIEAEVEKLLSEPIGELGHALDLSTEAECGVGNLMADCLRHRMDADLAVSVAGQAFYGSLPAGEITRLQLWEVCPSPANPGKVRITGSQLLELLQHGLDPEFTQERHHALRGQARGWMHISGATYLDGELRIGGEPVQPDKHYLLAGSDFEFEPTWGYTEADWGLEPDYEIPTILREALQAYLQANPGLKVVSGRIR